MKWGAVRVHEYEREEDDELKFEKSRNSRGKSGKGVERTQRDVPPKRDIWGPVSDDCIWQPGPWAGIWGPVLGA